MSVGHLYVFFGKISIQNLCLFLTELFNCLIELFVFLSLSCMSSLSILDINPSMNM